MKNKKTFLLLFFIITLIVIVIFLFLKNPTSPNPATPANQTQQQNESAETTEKSVTISQKNIVDPNPRMPTPEQGKKMIQKLNEDVRKDIELVKPTMQWDFPKLNKSNCEKEFFKAAYLSYVRQQHPGFGSLFYCKNNILKLTDAQFDHYQKLIAAAAKREKSFVLNGQAIELSEANLQELSQ